jgi:pyruvate/2-oxoglutarate dehydrogenase complex dihydrolipoamide acyltransferase (E2) component
VQEDGYVHSILVPEGKTVPVGTAVALLTEYEEDLHTLNSYEAPTANLYAEGHGLRTLTWQSYLQDEEAGEQKGCS